MPLKKETKKLAKADHNSLWHPFTRHLEWEEEEPLIIERASGNYLIDTEGRRYLDGISSLWVTVHGHRKKELDQAVKKQLRKVAHSTLLGLSSVVAIELSEKLIKVAPSGLKKVFYSDSGSTSVEIALKMAFHFSRAGGDTKKTKFLSFTGAYHGDTVGSMSVGEVDAFVTQYKPLLFKGYKAPYPYCYRCPLKKEPATCNLECIKKLEEILKKNSSTIAGCIIEPLVQGAAGMITSPPGFLKEVRRLTKKYNVLLIVDEVATGFGRTGKLFASEHEKIKPDILCIAKGLTGGYLPLAATLTTEAIFKSFQGTKESPNAFYHGHTYTGNPLGCAVALANLKIFKDDKTIEKIQPKIKLLKNLLEPFKDLPFVGEVRQRGLMVGIELVADKKTKKPFPQNKRTGAKICRRARERGLIIRPLGDTIILMPPLSIKESELRKITKIVPDCIKAETEKNKE
ncbi:MAG: adenosylmethionine--8-amino-7-oxononanoate transaminase [Deltaproteobacteria bacterium]|nr:adenosylmethionine--8-amino-7-oxononanoate transaminase [Deltaproteobacteria bacterium]